MAGAFVELVLECVQPVGDRVGAHRGVEVPVGVAQGHAHHVRGGKQVGGRSYHLCQYVLDGGGVEEGVGEGGELLGQRTHGEAPVSDEPLFVLLPLARVNHSGDGSRTGYR